MMATSGAPRSRWLSVNSTASVGNQRRHSASILGTPWNPASPARVGGEHPSPWPSRPGIDPFSFLRPRAIPGEFLTELVGPQIGRLPGECVIKAGKDIPCIDGGAPRLQAEVDR